ncbi:hypothetical protein EMPS_08921 [Entomortierella parvispora]|uniref:Uncharacterized protein n=1 Tax=Entomortierella parvispora TaxID=205924 RepID=A0A9P3HHS3_9FUNG|nr:hypothetical protein EMPS_08921 [Entomortierella parvispora]
MTFFRSSAPRSLRSTVEVPSSSSSTSLDFSPSSQLSQQPRRYLHKPSPLSLSVACFVLFQSFFSTVSEAFQCTYPNYNTEVQPGQTSLLTWQASSADLSTYDSITATLYCMDIDGPKGGIWRTISTLFSNRGLISTQGQYQFNVPNCGELAKDVAIRIVARGQRGTNTQNGACYFMMDPKAVVVTTPPPSPPPPVVTSSTPPHPTTNPVQATNPPKSSLTTLPSAVTSSTVLPVATGSSSSLPTNAPIGTTPTGSGSGGGYGGRPLNLPPLPPLPDDPSTQGSSGTTVKSNRATTIGATLGSICGFAIIAAVASFLVLRRRRARHHHPRDGADGLGLKKRLRLQGRGLKGSLKDENDHFHMMRDDDYYEDDYPSTEKPHQVKSVIAQNQKDLPDLIMVRAVGAVPMVPTVAKSSSLLDDISELDLGAWRQSSILSYPPLAHLPSSGEWKRSSSSSVLTPSSTSDVLSISSSAQASGDEEVSSVVRDYWVAAMAARAERSALPPPSPSSQSHKAVILGFDDTSSSSRAERHHDSIEEGEESEDLDAAYKGWVRNPFRSTVNSIQSYVNRSISTGLQSRLRSFTTFDSSTPSSNFFDDSNSNMTDEAHQQALGFPTRVNSEFLEHLSIKALRHEQRQLEYYTRYYSEHNLAVPSRTETSITMTSDDRRTSSVPSLTSTNDPFQTFDSNEVIMMDPELERDPFADPAQEPIDTGLASSTDAISTAYVPPPLPPPPPVTAHKSLAIETKQNRSNSVLLRSFPDPPSSPTSIESHDSKK